MDIYLCCKMELYIGNYMPKWEAAYCFGLLQWLNLLVVWHSLLLILGVRSHYSKWIEIGIGVCIMIVNVLIYSRKIDNIINRYNAISQQERLQGRLKMWIYVATTIISTIGLMTAVALSRESPQKKTIRDIIQSEMKIHKNHFTGEE